MRSAVGDRRHLGRRTISVGSLALGGRAKTPLVALLASAAADAGLRPAVLSRGYRGKVGARDEPAVVVGVEHGGRSWHAPAAARASELGDEPAWLAAVLPGIPVAVHPSRERAAERVLAEHEVDLFLLDGGFQTAVGRDIDVVMLDALRDPPFARIGAVREGVEALARAHFWGVLNAEGIDLPEHAFSVSREFGGLFELTSGASVDPRSVGPITIVAGVGAPESVTHLAREAGLTLLATLCPGDHRAPRRGPLARIDGPLLITEKDAVGWAAASPPAARTLVLTQALQIPRQELLTALLDGGQKRRPAAASTNRSSSSI
jgi:tetraacyldisaccharide 4'-kinase